MKFNERIETIMEGTKLNSKKVKADIINVLKKHKVTLMYEPDDGLIDIVDELGNEVESIFPGSYE